MKIFGKLLASNTEELRCCLGVVLRIPLWQRRNYAPKIDEAAQNLRSSRSCLAKIMGCSHRVSA
jgi:hypothetical protein